MEIDCRAEHWHICSTSTIDSVDYLEGSKSHMSRDGTTRALEALPSFELVSHNAPLYVPGWKTWQYTGAGAAFVGGGGALTGAAVGLLARSPGAAAFFSLVGAVHGGAVGAMLGWAIAPPAGKSTPNKFAPQDRYDYYRYRDRFHDNRSNFQR